MSSPRLLQALQANPNLRPNELAEIGEETGGVGSDVQPAGVDAKPTNTTRWSRRQSPSTCKKTRTELAAEKDKPFQLIGMDLDDAMREAMAEGEVRAAAASAAATAEAAKVAAESAAAESEVAAKAKKHAASLMDEEDASVRCRRLPSSISRAGLRWLCAGTKEERSILIRDSTKLVSLAVLDSPKVSDGEVEKFALQKNVLEAVLRGIPMRRKFAKNYSIMRNLVSIRALR